MQYVESSEAPRGTGPYSPALRVGDLVFVSGQGPLHAETHEVVGETVAEQTEKTLENIKHLLEAAGSSLSDVVRVNAYLADIGDYDEYNGVYERVFGATPRPTRTTVGAQLVDILVEIDCIAYVGARDAS